MGELIIAVVLLAGSFGGGFLTGKNKVDKAITEHLEQSKAEMGQLSVKLDSLRNLPAKIDTVRLVVDRVEYKTDTLILMNKDIYANTDTIKNELRRFVKK